jgi:hypothetical protein
MKFNRHKFFEAYRKEFGNLDQYQVSGLERLLRGFETYHGWWDNLSQIANALAQVKHETAHSFNPVVEGYYLAKTIPPDFQGRTAKVQAFQRRLKYYPHFGRGDIQLTWAHNYEKMDAALRRYFPEIIEDFQRRTGKLFDLVKFPEQALDGKISFCIFTVGMHRGMFTGRSLDQFINAREIDHFNARSIVNGDKNYVLKGSGLKIGTAIAQGARKFERILSYALERKESAATAAAAAAAPSTPTAIIPSGIIPSAGKNNEPSEEFDDKFQPTVNSASNLPEISEEPPPAAPPPPPTETNAANNSRTEVSVQNGDVSVKTEENQPPPENVAVEKPAPKGFIEKIKAQISLLTGGNIGVQAISDYGQQFQVLGLSARFWLWIGIIAGAASAVYILFAYLKHREEAKRDLEITNALVKANSTDSNKVVLVAPEEIAAFKRRGYRIVYR